MEKLNRVVITGVGCITPIGKNVAEFNESLKSGTNGIDKLTRVNSDDFKVKLAGEVKDYNAEDYIDKKKARRMDRFTQFAIIAADQAIADSGLDFDKVDRDRVGIYISSGIGGIETLSTEIIKEHEKGARMVSPFMVPMMIPNMAAGEIAIKYGLRGSSFALVTACASSTHAIGEAYRNIKHGYSDIIVTGGSEATIHMVALAGFQNMTALSLSEDRNAASLPFDERRSGFVMGEGGAVVIMESLDSATKRGAKIYGEVVGYGSTTDAYHITSPDPEGIGACKAIQNALKEANLKPEDIDYINAHGTGTPLNDKFETKAILKALGEYGAKVRVNSTKSMTGHLLGATGAMEAIACVLQMKDGYIHPTINLLSQDKECNLNVVKQRENFTPKTVLSNSLGFGGHNASIIIRTV